MHKRTECRYDGRAVWHKTVQNRVLHASRMQNMQHGIKKVFSCFLNDPVSRGDLMSTGSLFHAFGAATANALSEDKSLDRGKANFCRSAERSNARPNQGHWDNPFGISRDIPEIEQPRNPLGYPRIFVND